MRNIALITTIALATLCGCRTATEKANGVEWYESAAVKGTASYVARQAASITADFIKSN